MDEKCETKLGKADTCYLAQIDGDNSKEQDYF